MNESSSTAPAVPSGGTILGEPPAAPTPVIAEQTATTANADATEATVPPVVEGEGVAAVPDPNDPPKGEEEGAAEAEGAPEEYAEFILPADSGYKLEGDRLAATLEFARANNWTQEQAQAGVEKYVQMRQAEHEYERGQLELAARDEFGPRFTEVAEDARRSVADVEKLRPGFAAWIATNNVGSDPHMIWLMQDRARLLKEAPMRGIEQPSGSGSGPAPIEQRMYPSMQPKS